MIFSVSLLDGFGRYKKTVLSSSLVIELHVGMLIQLLGVWKQELVQTVWDSSRVQNEKYNFHSIRN